MDNSNKAFDDWFDDMYDSIVYKSNSGPVDIKKSNGKIVRIDSIKTPKKHVRFSNQQRSKSLKGKYVIVQDKKEEVTKISPKPKTSTIIRKSDRKEKTIFSKISKSNEKQKAKIKQKRKRKIDSIAKQVERSLFHQNRYTEPKKRNLLSRIILQNRLANGYYEDIEDDYAHIGQYEIERSKNAKKRKDRSLYREVQAYEDAKEDVTVRRGWFGFKVGLAALMLASSLALGNHVANEIKETFGTTNQVETIETISQEERNYYTGVINSFKENVKQNSGYEFDYLSDEELLDGYLRIIAKEKRVTEGRIMNAFMDFRDQEMLDEIVENSFDEGVYDTFSEQQKRDYRQLAFELFPLAQPERFGEKVSYIRNPIVYDELQTKNAAKEKGYQYTIVVNNDEKENIRNVGRLIHIRNTLEQSDYISASSINNGQDLLDNMVRQALGEQYETLSEREIRDYKQIAYGLLPNEAKGNYIKDPIDIEKSTMDMEIGE